MILFPAIDLKEGRCVRLLRGAMDAATVYNDDPADQARRFRAQGFRWLHVVDLDGARDGAPANLEIIGAIARQVPVPVQLGGGLRTGDAERVFDRFWRADPSRSPRVTGRTSCSVVEG